MKIRLNITNRVKLFISLALTMLYLLPYDIVTIGHFRNMNYVINTFSSLIFSIFLNAFLVYIIIKLISESIDIKSIEK